MLLLLTSLAFANGDDPCGPAWGPSIGASRIESACVDFVEPCSRHDDCYANCELDVSVSARICKDRCDDRFLQAMLESCYGCSTRYLACRVVARLYFRLVRLGGWASYDSAQTAVVVQVLGSSGEEEVDSFFAQLQDPVMPESAVGEATLFFVADEGGLRLVAVPVDPVLGLARSPDDLLFIDRVPVPLQMDSESRLVWSVVPELPSSTAPLLPEDFQGFEFTANEGLPAWDSGEIGATELHQMQVYEGVLDEWMKHMKVEDPMATPP